MRATSRLLAIGAVTTAVLLGSASTAMADSGTVNDKRYDVLVGNFDDSSTFLASEGTYHQRLVASYVDAKSLTVNHGKDFVSVRINMNKLGEGTFSSTLIKINGGTADDYQLIAASDGEGGLYAATVPAGVVTPSSAVAPAAGDTECSTESTTGKITGSTKTGSNGYLQVYIPRACLDLPKYLRAGGTTQYYDLPVNINSVKSLQKVATAAEADGNTYSDPINSKYFGAPQYTSWLARN
ncbi:hypothetical protein ASE12_01330 [Aeromicrobium sp. Root236]|uniref:hypothetical protein n=1 Tax=Aeromicrobium sp. Root236 TaxID=1736498 RepID=UPI0006FE33A1|nr:hypothetical protein [Aeromicrobium sp. Root236]KRC63522.1 hypothetical protein ASE12_01330 [Aeromicrobium sp. Root236]